MVCDFKRIKDKIHGYLDHGNFNKLLPFNPTAERFCKRIVFTSPAIREGGVFPHYYH